MVLNGGRFALSPTQHQDIRATQAACSTATSLGIAGRRPVCSAPVSWRYTSKWPALSPSSFHGVCLVVSSHLQPREETVSDKQVSSYENDSQHVQQKPRERSTRDDKHDDGKRVDVDTRSVNAIPTNHLWGPANHGWSRNVSERMDDARMDVIQGHKHCLERTSRGVSQPPAS